ncbi:MAG: response regulator [Planctomycetes bacterium]|nr:response regulator [Planctomycetota bacterium]
MPPSDATACPRTVRWVPPALGALALIIGVTTLTGWATDTPRLTNWGGHGISMQPNAALALTSMGAALLFLAIRRYKLVFGLGALVAGMGGATFFQHLSGINLGIDTLLFSKPWGDTATTAVGRMGPPASLSLFLLGSGVMLALGSPGSRGRGLAAGLALAASCIALHAIIAYLFRADTLYTLPRLTGIALPTAIVLMALAVGLLASLPDRQPVRTLLENSGAGLLARRAVPLIVALPLVAGWLRLRGQTAGYYDTGTGTALLTFAMIAMMCAVLWWGVAVVSKHERALVAVNEAKIHADMVLGGARDLFIVVDRDWKHTYTNDRVSEISDIPRQRLIGRILWEVFPATVGTPLEAAARRVMEQREPETLEYFYEPWKRWFDTRIYPTQPGGIAIFALEVTTRIQAEQAVREADRRKDEFLATLAHELRNPLAPICGAVELMKQAEGDRDLVRQSREMLERQTTQLVRLVDDLLDVSRITRDKLDLRKQRVDLSSVIGHAVESCTAQVQRAGHHLTVELPREPVGLEADPARLAQVFSNLLHNACKYTERGGQISIVAERQGTEVVVTVSDSGVGIPADMLPKVFELFTQVDRSLERSQGGLGIGLTLAKRLIEMHHGSITVESDGAGQGSRFTVRLPVAIETVVTENSQRPEVADPPAKPKRILVVDDNQDAASMLAKLLSLGGHETRVVLDGLAAVEVAASYQPEIVFLDIGLPKMNGYEVCRTIREQSQGRRILIIALSGWGREEDRARSKEAGFDEHLIKPVEYQTVIKLLSVEADKSHARVF